MLCYTRYVKCYVMLYKICYGMLYNICYVMLYNICCVILCYIRYVMLCNSQATERSLVFCTTYKKNCLPNYLFAF